MANEKALATKTASVLEKLNQAKGNIVARLPQSTDKQRFFLGIMTAIQKNAALAKCNPQSVLLAAYDAAEVGCDLSPSLALGWLIPYGEECNFQPSYRFFIQRAYDTGEVKSFFAEVVYADDVFERQFAPRRNLNHMPGKKPELRVKDNAIGAYALVEFTDDTLDWEYLTKEQIDRHRDKSKQKNSMKWVDFWEEGWRITAIRVLAKRLPLKGEEFQKLVAHVNRDAESDLIVIPMEETMSMPREVEQEPKSEKSEPKSEAAETKPAEKPAESRPAAEPAKDQEQDPILTGDEVKQFFSTAFNASWSKLEINSYLKKEFNVDGASGLRRSQAKAALDVMQHSKAK